MLSLLHISCEAAAHNGRHNTPRRMQEGKYADLGGYGDVKGMMARLLALYNAGRKPLSLVFFEDALAHLVRALRTLTLPHGHLLLVGVGGSGKQSLARLAAFAARCDVFEITLSRGYGEATFREDLKVRSFCLRWYVGFEGNAACRRKR